MSSRKSTHDRRIDELLEKLQPGDIVIASELSRLGRSTKETLNTIENLVQNKKNRLILIKQNVDMNPNNMNNLTNKVLITVFSMIAELERDFIAERTKEGQLKNQKGNFSLSKMGSTYTQGPKPLLDTLYFLAVVHKSNFEH